MGDNSSHTITKVGSTFIIDRNLTGELHIKLKVSKGAVLAGLLDDTDLDTEYGTSASTNFSPFIVHPALSKDKASRWLRKRLFSMPGPHMFLSPITKTQLDSDVEVTYVVPTTIDVPLGGQVTLLFWNSDAEMWQHPDEICSSERNHYNESTRLLTTRLCAEVFSYLPINAPYKPDTATSSSSLSSALWILGPRMLTMSVILSVSTNLPPFIQSTSFTLMEDSDDFNFTIIYTDDESDKVEFILREQPKHGTATVSSDGKLLYRPQADFCGTDIILLTGKEILDLTILALGIMPNMFNFSVTVQVKSVNDPPSIFYLPSQNDTTVMQQLMTGPLAGNGINITVLMQGNTTAPVELGVIAFNDVDSNDSLSFIKRTREVHDVSFEVSDLSSEDPWLSPINLSSVAGIGRKKVILHFTQNFSGHVEYDLRIKDAFDAFSRQLIINVYILMNPCIHGHCQPKASPDKCEDPKRAFTFGPYLCHCDLGYEGEWCQTETDECLSATCGPISYCIDLIGDYRCDNRILVAIIIICSILSLVAAVFGIFVFFRLKTSKTFTLREPSFSSGIEMQPISRSGVDDQYTFATSDSRLETIQSMVDMYCSPTAAEATVHSLEALQQTDRELDESSEPVKNAPSAEGHSHQIPPISTHIVVKF